MAQGTLLSSLRAEKVEEEAQPTGAPAEEPAPHQDASEHCLWVDEFAPQRYTELLSDDVRPCSRSSVLGSFVPKRKALGPGTPLCCQPAGVSGFRGGSAL